MQCKLNAVNVIFWMVNVVYTLYLSQYWDMCAGHAAYLQYRDISATCDYICVCVCFFFFLSSFHAKACNLLFFYLVTLRCGLNWKPPTKIKATHSLLNCDLLGCDTAKSGRQFHRNLLPLSSG
jgi:hypothetical protein